MRMAIVVVGIVLAVIGAVLLFVPVVPQANQTVQSGSSTPYVLFSVTGFSITGSIPVSMSWSSPTSVTILAAACSAHCSANVSQISGITSQTGTSGSFTLSQPDGGEVIFGVLSFNTSGSAPTVTLKTSTALTTVGSILLIVGIIVLILGVVVKSKKAKMAAASSAPMSSMPSSPSTTEPMQDSYSYPPSGSDSSNPSGSPPMGPS